MPWNVSFNGIGHYRYNLEQCFSVEEQQEKLSVNFSVDSFCDKKGDVLREGMREQAAIWLSPNMGTWSPG